MVDDWLVASNTCRELGVDRTRQGALVPIRFGLEDPTLDGYAS